MTTSPWILKTFQLDHTGETGAHLFIEARKPGIIAFFLNLAGLDPTAQLKVTKGAVSFRSTSMSGMIETSTALTQIGSFQGGYSKPIAYLFLGGFFLIAGISMDIAMDMLVLTWFGLIFALASVVLYVLKKFLTFGFETSGGAFYGLSFKRGVLNNVSVDITQVERALQLVNTLIGSASLGTSYALTDKVQKVAPQATISYAPAPAVAAQHVHYPPAPNGPPPSPPPTVHQSNWDVLDNP